MDPSLSDVLWQRTGPIDLILRVWGCRRVFTVHVDHLQSVQQVSLNLVNALVVPHCLFSGQQVGVKHRSSFRRRGRVLCLRDHLLSPSFHIVPLQGPLNYGAIDSRHCITHFTSVSITDTTNTSFWKENWTMQLVLSFNTVKRHWFYHLKACSSQNYLVLSIIILILTVVVF